MQEKLLNLEEKLGYKFKDRELLLRVFIHRSYLNEHRGEGLEHNERLEFLGDAVLELVVTEYLYTSFNNPEGEMTNWRSALVKGEMLAKVAGDLEFYDLLLLSHGEEKNGGKSKNYLLANCFEAFVGALYLDQGMDACRRFIKDHILCHLEEILQKQLYIDPKSRLQEYTQEQFGITPNYQVLDESGPDHAKEFLVGVYLGEKEMARGTGSSKQSAQIASAAKAMEIIIEEDNKE